MSLVQEMVEILVAGLSAIATGIGTGLQNLVKGIFVTGEGTQASPYALSVFGIVTLSFAGIALAVGLSTRIVLWVTSLGKN